MEEHHLSVARTARYFTRGEPGPHVTQIWFVLHGYSQLAATFLSYFKPIDDGTRYIVAPEGLSRFYLQGSHGRIGASWMTREDREREIDDYVGFLNALHDQVMERMPGRPPVHVLGFSQGAATASRWLAGGHVRADRLVLWGGRLPPEFDTGEGVAFLRGVRVDLVAGVEDGFVPPDVVREDRERLARIGLPYREITFDGGHRMDRETLLAVAAA